MSPRSYWDACIYRGDATVYKGFAMMMMMMMLMMILMCYTTV